MKTQKKLLFICILLVNITFGWSQVLCEECSDCKEEEEIENVENTEETEDIDYKLNVGEENEDMFLDEADMLGEELGEEIAEEVAEEVVVDVTSEAVVEVAAIAATSFLDVIPVVGEILQALAIVALSGYFLYELSKDTSANRRKHELALVRHRAEELEHKSWSPLFPSFSININDLESKRDTVSFIINTAKYIGEEQLKDYLDENNIKCEVAYDDSGINQSISLSKEPLIDFTPCAFETYSHPYTAGIENDSYKDEYRWTIPDINLFVENGKIKTSVKSVWITDFINKFKYVEKKDTSEYERDYTAANNNIVELMLAKVTNKGFKEIGSIP